MHEARWGDLVRGVTRGPPGVVRGGRNCPPPPPLRGAWRWGQGGPGARRAGSKGCGTGMQGCGLWAGGHLPPVWVAGPGRSEASGCLGRVTRALGREMGENERNRETGTSHAMWWGAKGEKTQDRGVCDSPWICKEPSEIGRPVRGDWTGQG